MGAKILRWKLQPLKHLNVLWVIYNLPKDVVDAVVLARATKQLVLSIKNWRIVD